MEIKRVCALYFSATGNTEKTVAAFAETLAEQLGVPWERLPFTKPAERERDYVFADTDLVVVGTPTYAGKLPNKILPDLKACLHGNGALTAAIVTFGTGPMTTLWRSCARFWRVTDSIRWPGAPLWAVTPLRTNWRRTGLTGMTERNSKNLRLQSPTR